MLWFLLACGAPPPATPNSRSAGLVAEVAALGERSARLAERAESLEGRFDAFRAAPPEQQAIIRAEIAEEARALREEAQIISEESRRIEASAAVYPR